MLFKVTFFTLTIVAGIFAEASPVAKPAVVSTISYTAPLVVETAPIVTATSSQVITRNYNGIAAPLVTAPVAYTASAYAPYYAPFAYAVSPVSPLKYRTDVSAPIKYTSAVVA